MFKAMASSSSTNISDQEKQMLNNSITMSETLWNILDYMQIIQKFYWFTGLGQFLHA